MMNSLGLHHLLHQEEVDLAHLTLAAVVKVHNLALIPHLRNHLVLSIEKINRTQRPNFLTMVSSMYELAGKNKSKGSSQNLSRLLHKKCRNSQSKNMFRQSMS